MKRANSASQQDEGKPGRARKLDALLRPRSVAVIGASERLGNGRNAVENLLAMGFQGEVFPVNPRYERVLGIPCFPSLAALPVVPDALYVGVGAKQAVEEIRAADALGVPAAVVHAGGFAEIGAEGAALQRSLAEAAGDMALCGPNCLGLINVQDRVILYGASMPRQLPPGHVGAVFQSGSTLLAVMNAGRDLQFSHLISSGNEAVLDSADYFEFLVDDLQTRTIIGFIDGFRQPQRFVAAASRARQAGKPIILLKPGRSEGGRKAALAHTGALAGSNEVLEAVFRKYGVIRAHDLDELVELAVLFSGARTVPRSGGLVVTCVSGGEMAVVLDAAADQGLSLPPLAEETTAKLRALLPGHIAIANPLDVTATGLYEPNLYRDAIMGLATDQNCGLLAVSQDFPGAMGPVQAERYRSVARSLVEAATATEKPVVVFSNLSGDTDPEVRSILREGRVPLLLGARESLKAIAALLRFGADKAPASLPLNEQDVAFDPFALSEVQTILRAVSGPMSERDSKAVLARFGMAVPREELARNAPEAAASATAIGFPVVLKISSADIPHKTEAGGVRIGLANRADVSAAFEAIMDSAGRFDPKARIDGVSVQQQITDGIELILGCTRDDQFGPVIVLGFGGIFVETVKDTAFGIPPLRHDEAEQMVRSLRAASVLNGVRGKPPADLPALIDTLVRLSHLALALSDDLEALDINPLLVRPAGFGVVAADALFVLRQHGTTPTPSPGTASCCAPPSP